MSARCGSCGEAIIWAVTETGRNMPVDAIPVETGNVAVHRDAAGHLHARVLKQGDTVAEWEIRGTAHWATCPQADQHRKKKREPVTCKTVEVDGTPVLVRGQGQLTEADQAALTEVVQAAKRKYGAEHG